MSQSRDHAGAAERGLQTFLARWLGDLERGEERSLAHYQALFPGRELAIAAEWESLHAGPGERSASAAVQRTIGPYRILSEIGRGGQGAVFLAEDTRLPRKVALKALSSLAALSDRSLARFLREADVASRLDHPCICPVYERGSADGVPYIAMRYVEGESLAMRIGEARRLQSGLRRTGPVPLPELDVSSSTLRAGSIAPAEAGAEHRVALKRVLLLIETVARALHEAHEAGFVHRDVKPSNILVARDGRPAILDFGLAGARIDGFEELTHTGELFGTPAYMSPEQVSGRHEAVDRRTDVYSLGVTLYECLTLRRPFESSTRQELFRSITLEEPSDPRDWNSSIPSEIVAIVGRTLEKEPGRRYATALDLAEDLRRFRSDEPVLARPQTELYRLRKLARRHRGLVIGLAVAFSMLLVAVVGTSLGMLRALRAERVSAREADKAGAVRDFVITMLAAADPAKAGRDIRVVDALEAAERELEVSFESQAEIRAALHLVIGSTYGHLGVFDASERNLVRSLEMHERLLGPDHVETLRAVFQLGSLYWNTKRPAKAEPLLQRARVGLLAELGPANEDSMTAAGALALVLSETGRFDEAGELFRESYELSSRHLGPEHAMTLSATNNLARWYEEAGNIERALELLRENLAVRRRVLGEDHPKTLIATDSLALVLQHAGEPEQAEALFRRALEGFVRRLGEGHVDTLRCQGLLAVCLREQGRREEAETILTEGIGAAASGLPAHQQDSLELRWQLAVIQLDTGRIGEAADTAHAALDDALACDAPAVMAVWRIAGSLLPALLALDDHEGARATLERIDPFIPPILAREDGEAARMANTLLPFYEELGFDERARACRELLVDATP